jgi:hypothetical protein
MSLTMETNRPRMYKVIVPVEKKDGTKFWMRVGSAFPNKDGSTNVYLDAMPLGQNCLQIREMTDDDFNRRRSVSQPAPVPPPGGDDLPF